MELCDNTTLEPTNATKNLTLEFDFWAMQTVLKVHLYYSPLLIILGSIGNFVSMYVFYVSKLRLQSTSQYLTALAISDTLFLLQLLPPWLADINLTDIFHWHGFCQIISHISYVTCCTSAWLVVAFTVERFVAVLYPLRRNAVCTVARARYIIFGIVVSAVVSNLPVLRFVNSVNGMCDIDRDYIDHAFRFNIVDTVVSFTLPLLIIIVLNVSIMAGVCRLERARQQLLRTSRPTTSPQPPQPTRPVRLVGCPRSQHKVTRMLLLVSTVFVVFNLPAYSMRMLGYAYDTQKLEAFGGRWLALQQITTMLFHTNFGINFLLYCLSGQNFRQALMNTMPWVRARARQGIAVRHATIQQGRAGSLSSTSALYVSNGTDGMLVADPLRRRREERYIFRCIFDNSRHRANLPRVAIETETLDLRDFDPAQARRTNNSYIGTTRF